MKLSGKKAFTLVEMIVAVAVTGVLIGLTATAAGWAMNHAKMAREVNAARTLINAYTGFTADNDGMLLPGFDDSASGYKTPTGEAISSAAAHRYPFRLAPYFSYALDGTILVNRNKEQIAKLTGSQSYFQSLYPALGMNVTFVGGWMERGKVQDAAECVTRISGAVKPSMTLVFASAGDGANEEKVDGFYRLDPPNKQATLWTGGDDGLNKSPDLYGHVDFRHNGRAVCAFLDGGVRMMNPKDLRDMRYWSPNAQIKDSESYTIPLQGPAPGRGNGR